jgi:hypothetical protein
VLPIRAATGNGGAHLSRTNTSETMRSGFATQEPGWLSRQVRAQLRLPDEPEFNKAVCPFETAPYVGSVTAWGTGTVEFMVLDLRTSR